DFHVTGVQTCALPISAPQVGDRITMGRTLRVTAAALVIALPATAGLAQDAEKGADVFRRCTQCHAVGPNAANVTAPNLNGIVGQIGRASCRERVYDCA